MDKNTLTGLFLIALVLIGYSYFAKPQEAQSQGTEQIQAKQRTPSTDTKPHLKRLTVAMFFTRL